MLVAKIGSLNSILPVFDSESENLYHIKMGSHSIIIIFFLFVILSAALTIGGIFLYEKKKGSKITSRFREFSSKYKISEKDLRSVPRILIPDNINVSVKLNEKPYARLKGKVVDMSLSGFRVSFRSPFKVIPDDQIFRNVTIITPLKRITINSIKIVRIENSVKKMIFALYIKDIDENDYTELRNTMIYFEKFSKNGN